MQLKVGGVDRTGAVLRNSLRVSDAIGRRTTCSFRLKDLTAALHFSPGQSVEIWDDAGAKVFGGTIDRPGEQNPLGTNALFHAISCTDWHQLADRRIVAETYQNMAAGQIVQDLVRRYLEPEGVVGRDVTRTETTQSDFSTGTLSGVQASTAGDLELATSGAPTFTRPSVAYLSTGQQVASGVPRYEAGQFGQAVMVEEGTTNLLTANQSSVETDLSGITPYWDTVLSRDTSKAFIGAASVKVDTTTKAGDGHANHGVIFDPNAVGTKPAGTYFVASAYAWIPSGVTVTISGRINDASGAYLQEALGIRSFIGNDSWQRIYTNPFTRTDQDFRPGFQITVSGSVATVFWVDAAQLEQKQYVTSWIPGGTPRSPEALTIPTAGVLSPQEGTIEVTYIPNLDSSKVALGGPGQDWWWIFGAGSAANTNELRLAYNNGAWRVRVGGSSDTIYTASFAAGQKISLALAWKQGVDARFFINGVKVATFTPSNFDVGTTISIGYSYLWNHYCCNGLIDDLRISSRARTDAEIAAAYSSNAPLLVDEFTTYKLNFDGNLNYGEGGYRVSPALDLSPAGVAASSAISWTATTPTGTAVQVKTSLDGGATWQQATNGGAIPGITPGMDLTGKSLLVRQTLTTEDTTQTPQLHDLTATVRGPIQDGPTVVEAVFNYVPVTQALDALAERAGFSWWIDPDKKLHFVERSTYAAPWSVSSTTKIQNVEVEQDRGEYRNRQYIKAGKDVTDPQVESFKGDGSSRTFTVGFPIAKVPTVKVNGVAKTVGIKGVDIGKDWYWNKGDPVITQDQAGVVLTSADNLEVTYQGFFDVVLLTYDEVAINERKALEGGTGYYEAVDEEPYLSSRQAAFESANAKLRRYAQMGKTLRFETELSGLKPGQLLTVNLPIHNISNEQFLIEQVDFSDFGAAEGRFRYVVTAVSGQAVGGWVKFFKNMASRGQTFVIRENIREEQILIVLVQPSEAWAWGETFSVTPYACPVPSSTLYPSTTLYPC